MGSGRWDSSAWDLYSTAHVAGKTTDKIYTSRSMKKEMDPLDVTIRESRDSDVNPMSNAIIVAQDVTGSMNSVLDAMVRKGLPTLATELYARKPVSDPHIMFMGVGDVQYDEAPLQVTQFEADIRIAEQLKTIWLEGHGGGNNFESYHLPWYFAGMYTSIDCFEKRGKKGYLFTVGDEFPPTAGFSSRDLKKVFSDVPGEDMTLESTLDLANKMYNVYHVIVEEGNCARSRKREVFEAWTKVLGQNVIRLSDHTKLAEVIVSMIQANEGVSKETIVKSWDGSTSIVVDRALADHAVAKASSTSGIVDFS